MPKPLPETAQETLQKVDEAVGVRPRSARQVERVLYAPQNSRGRKLFFVLITVVLLLGISFIAYQTWKDTTESSMPVGPAASTQAVQAVYETMLQNSMQVRSYQQTMTIGNRDSKTGAEAKTVIALERDVSDIAHPRLRGTVEVQQRQQATTLYRKGQLLSLGNQGTYFRLDESLDTVEESTNSAVKTPNPIDNDKLRGYWIAADEVATPQSLSLGLFLSSIPSDDLNTTRGELTVGNVPEKRRKELLNFLKDGQVYTIVSSKPETIDKQDVIAYQIAYNANRLRAYNSMLPAPPRIVAAPNPPPPYVTSVVIYVDPIRKLPVRMQFTKGDVNVVIDYAKFNQSFAPMQIPPNPRRANEAFGIM